MTTRRIALLGVVLEVNGKVHRLSIHPWMTLLDALRDELGLTGAKKGCDRGECGACTVHVEGRRVNACLTLAAQQDGRSVTTIEGLGDPAGEHPVQRAFVTNDALQCGFCTPGQIMSAAACVAEGHAGSADEIRDWMSGNICRCGAYPQILSAVASSHKQGGDARA
jgi:xanthine dehydrogenase YagT iron-sulfur-binding subunit